MSTHLFFSVLSCWKQTSPATWSLSATATNRHRVIQQSWNEHRKQRASDGGESAPRDIKVNERTRHVSERVRAWQRYGPATCGTHSRWHATFVPQSSRMKCIEKKKKKSKEKEEAHATSSCPLLFSSTAPQHTLVAWPEPVAKWLRQKKHFWEWEWNNRAAMQAGKSTGECYLCIQITSTKVVIYGHNGWVSH